MPNATIEALPCMLCGAPRAWQTRQPIRSTETKENFRLIACAACGILRTWPVPSDLSRYYDASAIGKIYHQAGGKIYQQLKRLSFALEMRRFIPPEKNRLIIDAGCGSGDFSRFLHEHGHANILAADAGPERPFYLKAVAAVKYGRLDFSKGRVEGFPMLTGGFVILRHVLEHLADPGAFLRQLINCGASEFYIAVPNARSLESRLLGEYWHGWDPPRHLWHFDMRTLSGLLERCGCRIIKRGHLLSPLLFISIYRIAVLKNWPAPLARLFQPNSSLHGIMSAANLLLPANVCCIRARIS